MLDLNKVVLHPKNTLSTMLLRQCYNCSMLQQHCWQLVTTILNAATTLLATCSEGAAQPCSSLSISTGNRLLVFTRVGRVCVHEATTWRIKTNLPTFRGPSFALEQTSQHIIRRNCLTSTILVAFYAQKVMHQRRLYHLKRNQHKQKV